MLSYIYNLHQDYIEFIIRLKSVRSVLEVKPTATHNS